MSGANVFDVISAKAWEIVEFHTVTHGVTLTDDERDAVELGLSSGVHAAIEHYRGELSAALDVVDGDASLIRLAEDRRNDAVRAAHAASTARDAALRDLAHAREENERLQHRLYPGQGEDYANEVERQRGVIEMFQRTVLSLQGDLAHAQATIAAVRALVPQYQDTYDNGWHRPAYRRVVDDLRRALDGGDQ